MPSSLCSESIRARTSADDSPRMHDTTLDKSHQLEEDRIRIAYGRRVCDGRYSFFNAGHLFMLQQRERQMLELLRRHGFARLETIRVFEIGCGTGYWIRQFIQWGARPENVGGIDLLAERLAEAARLCPGGVSLSCGNAARLEHPDASFDIVLQSTAFTSILDISMKQQIGAEMLRVLEPNGLIVWYDYRVNNPWNPDVRGIGRREVEQLFPGCRVELQSITLAPPLSRSIAPFSVLCCQALESVPFLRTHLLGAIRKDDGRSVR
jgi:ubiquinone/menaquinone biosynthesis C-methylase UbiE